MGQLERDNYCESVYCGGIRLILTNGTRATGAQDVWSCLITMLNRILQSTMHHPSWSHLSMDRPHSQTDLRSQSAIIPGPHYRPSDLGHMGRELEVEPASSGLGGSSNPQFSSRGQIGRDSEQADQYLQQQLVRGSGII